MIKDKKIFIGRLNDDDADTVFPEGDYRNALNCRMIHAPTGDLARVKNVPSTVQVTSVLYGLNDQVIGAFEDIENDRIFYFLWSDTRNQILCYRKSTDDVKVVLQDTDFDTGETGLGFSTTNKITGIAYLDGVLYWTDNNREPKRLNVERGMRTYDAAYVPPSGELVTPYTTPLRDEDISDIRRQPVYPPIITKLTSSSVSSIPNQDNNNIENDSFQFAYRYQYKDGEYSTLGAWSQTANFNNPDASDTYDTIRVQLSKAESIRPEVEKIEVLVREFGTNVWLIIKTWDRTNDNTAMNNHNDPAQNALFYDFFNSKIGYPIAEADSVKPFDRVPIRAAALEIADNRKMYANCVIGYDPIDSLNLAATNVAQSTGATLTGEYVHVTVSIEQGVPPDEINAVGYATVVLVSGSGDTAVDGYYNYSSAYGPTEFDDGLLPTVINLSSGDRMGPASDFPTDQDLIDYFVPSGWTDDGGSSVDSTYTGTQPSIFGLGTSAPIAEGTVVHKMNSKYQVGIVFFDFAGRNNGAYTNDNCIVVTEDRTYNSPVYNTGINWTLPSGTVSAIPTWATHYQIVLTKNLTTTNFVQGFVDTMKYVAKDDAGVYTFSDTFSLTTTIGIAWDLSRLFEEGLGYTFAEGDLLKAYPSDNSAGVVYEITDQQGKYVITEPKDLGAFTGTSNALEKNIIEIFTPRRGMANEPFYEVGKVYRIDNPGAVTRAFSQVSGTLTGDVTLKSRSLDSGSFVAETMSPNDTFWSEWNTDHGRVHLVLTDAKQATKPTNIIWSNTYIQGTNIRGLSSYDAADEKILDAAIGPIRKLVLTTKTQADGTVMLAIGENETASLYLGETQIVDSEGASLVGTSGNIIGTYRVLRGSYGTKHPESVIEHQGKVAWFDQKNNCFVRYASNGLFPISDIKLRRFAKRLGDYMEGKYIPGTVDEHTDQYLWSVPDLGVEDGIETLADFTTELLLEGSLAITALPISLGVVLQAKVNYELVITPVSVPVAVEIYVGAVLEYSGTITGTTTITINSTAGGSLSYTYVPKTGIIPGRIDVYGPAISCHQFWDGKAKTISFYDVDGMEGWGPAYSFAPEWMSRSGNLLVTFKNGRIYTHDGTTYNTFYGVQYRTVVSWLVTQPMDITKIPRSVKVSGNNAPTNMHFRTEYPHYVQSTNVESAEFIEREGVFHAEVFRDRLSPNVTGTFDEKLFKGENLRAETIEICAEWATFTEELDIKYVTVAWTESKGH